MNDSALRTDDGDPELVQEELVERLSLVDALVLAVLPAVSVLVFLWPGGAERFLVLHRTDPTPVATVTTHFVHRSTDHLLSNLVAYALVVPTGYGLSLVAGRRRSFFVGFGLLVAVGPPSLAVFDLLAYDHGAVFGFSGLAMAFTGFLPVVVGAFVERRVGMGRAESGSAALFFAGLGFIAALVIPPLWVRIPVVLLAAGFAAAFLRWSVEGGPLGGDDARPVRRGDVELAGVGVLVFAVVLLMGFTGESPSGGAVVNTYGHLLGYVIGFVVPYLAWLRLDRPVTGPGEEIV